MGNIMYCKDCRFYQHDGHYGSCKRYPKTEVKSGGDWCGEFKQIEMLKLPVVEIDTKRKPGRPAKEKE